MSKKEEKSVRSTNSENCYQAIYQNTTKDYQAENLDDFYQQVSSDFTKFGDPKQIVTPEYGKLPFDAFLFHQCCDNGKITEDELIEMLSLEGVNNE